MGVAGPADAGGARTPRVWFFDLDNTLHDASVAVFPHLRDSMTRYIQEALGVAAEEAHLLRVRYWQRYGATLLGLVRHHGVSVPHFLHETHRLPDLEGRLTAFRPDRAALQRLPGLRCVLTNAPRAYAQRVLRTLRLDGLFHAVISIEDMRNFGHLRPKPDARMFRTLCARLRVSPCDCVLIEDTLEHQKAAHGLGMRTVWMQRYLRASAPTGASRSLAHCRRPAYVDRRISRLRDL